MKRVSPGLSSLFIFILIQKLAFKYLNIFNLHIDYLISMTLNFKWFLVVIPFLQIMNAEGQKKVLIAAAADLHFVMDSLVAAFIRTHPEAHIQVVYGSSGNFYEQIRNGAPFDLFFSADMEYPEKLHTDGKILGSVNPYGVGSLVLWSKTIDPALQGMHTLENPSLAKIAIANPAHAPYGKRAIESLRFYGIYDKVKDKLVMGENISEAAEFSVSGSAEMGMIALSLALSPALKQAGGKYWVVPAKSHRQLEQGYVLLLHAKGNRQAQIFYQFIGTPIALSILNQFGFSNPNP